MAKAKKIYLSPAAHIHDNSTRCPGTCSENTHCNAYMDIVERRLRAHGFDVRRGDKALTGSAAMNARVREANTWGADLYYVAHTNAGGGRYSMTMCWSDQKSIAKAKVIHKCRQCITHKVQPRTDLYEIRATKMTCLYDELFFHDSAATEYAAKLASEKGFDEVLLLGGLGGRRVEHTLANLCTGLGLERRGVRTTLLDERSRITYVMPGETRRYPKENYFFFSAFPMEGRAEGVCEHGSYYELDNAELTAAYPLGVSNEYAEGSDCITISTRRGALVAVETIPD